jgi:hypothetical protein
MPYVPETAPGLGPIVHREIGEAIDPLAVD